MWNQLHTKQLQNLQNSSTRTRVKCGFQVHMSSSSSSFFLLSHSPLLFLVGIYMCTTFVLLAYH
ncbi:hypothetical protein HanRHA438_Chr15g0721151 [Helianthus annuus]|uniref:Uncharacterized protein n=1 Tax=Helianthus annuus TaxID=4232 RepID=A0A251V5B2_HELAN|nr:hypothetical protein HanXRQr2_Chr15g0708981 [Helianthus annuus]KAJ0846109.1 hypothetical protein HanRHA438_Chr15g0721151 [Helianthus annuus]